MKTVIGLFSKDEEVQRSIYKLQVAGLAEGKISILTHEEAVRKFLDGNQNHIVEKYAGWGAVFGITIFNLYDLTVGAYAWTNLFGYSSPSFWVFVLLMLTAMGALFGASAGWLFGVEKLDTGSRLYTWNVGQGSKLMVVQVNNELAPKVIDLLHQENGVAIKTLQSRFRSFWQAEPHSIF